MDMKMNPQTKMVNIFNQEKRKILCIANQHDYLGDSTIFHEKELQVGKQYTFVKGERMVYGLMVHLEELPCEYGYHSYLFEELQPYDAQILEKEDNNWIKVKLDESEKAIKEGSMRTFSREEVFSRMKEKYKRRFYLTGDCHGDFKKIDFFCQHHDISKDDVMIILGDAGINYWLDKTDQKIKKHLSGLPISFLVVHGNHEARASEIESYKERNWMGGTVYYEEEFPDILFAKDGEIYNFDGKKGIVIGGAYSVDKDYRLSVGLPWFESEQPSAEIKSYVEEQLQAHDWTVDYVLSHTCPLFIEPTDLVLDDVNWSRVDKTTEEWLEQIHKKLKYQKWYFGHFHENRCYATMEMLYEEIKELGSNDFLQRVGRPKYRRGEWVIFSNGSDDIYGRIAVVDAYGIYGQPGEVSYDIEGIDGTQYDKTLYKHIPESVVEKI